MKIKIDPHYNVFGEIWRYSVCVQDGDFRVSGVEIPSMIDGSIEFNIDDYVSKWPDEIE